LAKNKPEIRVNPQAVKLLQRIAEEDIKTFGQMALAQSREVCPVAEEKGGTLKRSLEMKVVAPKVIELRGRTHYAGYVHFGTTRMAARPFFAWGTDAAIPQFEQFIRSRSTYR